MNEQKTAAENSAPSSRKTGGVLKALRWVGISIGGLLATLLAIIAFVVIFGVPIDLSELRGKIETVASEALGREFTIEGPLTLIPTMPPAVQIEGVHVGNPEGWPAGDLAQLKLARAQLRILPLLKGEILIEEITVEGLQVNLETNAEDEPNWLLKKPEQAPEPEEPKEPAPALQFIELAELSLSDIVLTHRDAASGETFELRLDDISGSAEDEEPMQLLIHGAVQEVPYEVTFNAGSLAALVGGSEPWPLDVAATAVGAKLTITGEIAEPLRGKGLGLDFDLTGPMMKDLEAILGTKLPPIRSFGLSGRIEEAEGKYRIADLKGDIATTGITGQFQADISGARPRLHGNIDVKRIDAGPFFAAIDAEKTTPAEAKPEQPQEKPAEAETGESSKTAGKLNVDEPILTLEPFEQFDAQFNLTIHEVVNAPITLRDASLEVSVADGKLIAPLTATVAEVPFKGELRLAPEDNQPKLAISLEADKSDIGELAQMLTGAKGIEGQFDTVELALSTQGETIRSLVETAELRFAIAGASLSYGHETGGNPVEFTLDTGEMVFPAAAESQVNAKGSLLGEPFALEFKGGTFIDSFVQQSWPLALSATGGGAKLGIKGTVRQAKGDTGTEFDFALSGKSIGGLAAWIGVSPKAKQAYQLSGKAAHTETGIRIGIDKAEIGKSGFAGDLGIRKENDKPITFAKLDFNVLDLDGLASLFPKTPQKPKPATERKASTIDVPILPQGIEIFDADIDIAIERIKIEPADIAQLSLSSQIRDGYVEKAPLAVVIAGTPLKGNFAADLRGDVPKFDLDMHSDQVDIGALLAELGVAQGLALTASRFDLNLAMQGASTREILAQSEFSAGIQEGLWSISDPNTKGSLDIHFPKGSISAKREKPITLAINGRIDKTPVKIELSTDSLASFAKPKKRLRLDVGVALAEANLKLTGTAPLPVQAQNLQFEMDFRGEQFSGFDELLNASLPPWGPYRLGGEFGSRETGYYVENLQLQVGKSTLNGALDLKTTQAPPRLTVDLTAKTIQLDDFKTGDWSPVADEESKAVDPKKLGKPKASQDKPAQGQALLSPDAMRRLNAKVTVNVEKILSGQDPLGNGTLTATLEKGRFSVDPLTLNIPGGSMNVGFALEPTNKGVDLEANAKIEKLDYGILARRIDPQSDVGGVISVDVDLKTRGPNLGHIMQHSNGHIDFALWPKDLNAGIFDLWAVNLFVALMPSLDSENSSKVNCVIARFGINDGIMRPTALLIDSTQIQASGDGVINFQTETIEFKAKPKSKKPQMFSAQTPVQVQGQFADFKVGLPKGALAGTTIRMITSPVTVPFKRIFTEKAPPDGKVACEQAWSQKLPPE